MITIQSLDESRWVPWAMSSAPTGIPTFPRSDPITHGNLMVSHAFPIIPCLAPMEMSSFLIVFSSFLMFCLWQHTDVFRCLMLWYWSWFMQSFLHAKHLLNLALCREGSLISPHYLCSCVCRHSSSTISHNIDSYCIALTVWPTTWIIVTVVH